MPWVAWALSEEGTPLPRHPDARLTPRGRALPCERVGGGVRVSDAAAMAGEPRARGPVTRVRQGRGRPGEPLHADARKVTRIPRGGGHGALGRGCGSRRAAGASCPRVAVDDNSRVAYAEQLPDEREETACAFMGRAIAFHEGLGVAVERVMTDNGSACRSGEFNAPLEAHGIRHKYTRPLSPWQNGKVERMNGTLAREWQYARAWESEDGRASALASFIERYNLDRPHSACGGLPPMSRMVGVNNVLAHNT